MALVPRDLSSAPRTSAATSPQLPVLTSANLSYAVVVGDTCRLECQVSLVVIQGVTSAGCYNLQDKNQFKH